MQPADRPRGDGDPIAGFEFYLRREREASGKTVRGYTYWVGRWAEWCRENSVSPMLATPLDIRTFSTSGEWSRKTRAQLLSSLRAFYRYCQLDGFVDHSPAYAVEGPRIFAKRGPHYKPEQARRLLAAPVDLVDKLIIGLGLFAGVRTGEGLGLDRADIALRDGLLHVRRTFEEPTTKGKREREIPLHPWLREPLRTAHRIAEDRLVPLREEAYRNRMKRLCERAEVPYYGPHGLRRTFSTTLIQLGVREGVVRHLMGHMPTVTDLYAAVTEAECRKAVLGLRY